MNMNGSEGNGGGGGGGGGADEYIQQRGHRPNDVVRRISEAGLLNEVENQTTVYIDGEDPTVVGYTAGAEAGASASASASASAHPSSRHHSQPPQTTTPSPSTPHTPSKNIKYLPRNFYDCPMNDLVRLVSSMLQELVALNDALPFKTDQLTRFHSRSVPGISVQDYLIRIIKFCTLEKSIVLSIIYFIDLLCTTYGKFNINSLTVHRFMITAAMVGSKGLCDSFCTNSHYARVGGVSKVELNLLEVEFLTRVDYRIVPKYELLTQYYESMVARLEGTYMFSNEPTPNTEILSPPAGLTPAIGLTPPHSAPPLFNRSERGSSQPPLSEGIPMANSTSNPATTTTTTTATTASDSQHHQHRSVKVTLKEAALSLSKLMLPSDIARKEGRKNKSSALKRRFSSSAPNVLEQEEHEHPLPSVQEGTNTLPDEPSQPQSQPQSQPPQAPQTPQQPPQPSYEPIQPSPKKRANIAEDPNIDELPIPNPMTPKRPKPTP